MFSLSYDQWNSIAFKWTVSNDDCAICLPINSLTDYKNAV